MDLDENRLNRVPREMNQLTQLKEAHLRLNKITKLHAGAFNITKRLERLWINYNPLSVIEPGAFTGQIHSLTKAIQIFLIKIKFIIIIRSFWQGFNNRPH